MSEIFYTRHELHQLHTSHTTEAVAVFPDITNSTLGLCCVIWDLQIIQWRSVMLISTRIQRSPQFPTKVVDN
ncbi:hypothetical protein FRX31_012163 [Thalictrum thalictroides]|uniref:Uncharacterized protein n=1 Tax=Thalictrum thalictroides TaxID=46969 RepID=A0A7J6WLJ5_THATH|nr:hypothetical protein FRX31_012163 [Thalictrum thalictroides]